MTKILIIGGGIAGKILIDQLLKRKEYKIIGIIDDNITDKKIKKIPVLGKTINIDKVTLKYKIEEIIIAIPSADQKTINKIIQNIKSNIKINIIPGYYEIIEKSFFKLNQIKKIESSDLLGREEIGLDKKIISKKFKNKIIFVTGGGGSIGSEIIRQLLTLPIKKVIALGHGENSIFDLVQEYKNNKKFDYVIGDIKDQAKMEYEIKKHKPSIIFHTAAHKHVFLMEKYPDEAIKNNILGTYNCAIAAIKAKVKDFILISTDKAVEPESIMGMTKNHAEKIINSLNKFQNTTNLSIVRFGNVLGSRGSVIPIFERQIKLGGPVTITNPDVTRYFMSIREAARLVIKGAYLNNGKTYILDMGKPIKIIDLAKNLIKLSQNNSIKIVTTGLTKGEKLEEKLFTNKETKTKTKFNKLYEINNEKISTYKNFDDLNNFIENIRKTANTFNNKKIKKILFSN